MKNVLLWPVFPFTRHRTSAPSYEKKCSDFFFFFFVQCLVPCDTTASPEMYRTVHNLIKDSTELTNKTNNDLETKKTKQCKADCK